jgi:hypothetical protein
MSNTTSPQSESTKTTAQPAKTVPAWSLDRAAALRQAAQNRGPGACNCGINKDSPRIEQ